MILGDYPTRQSLIDHILASGKFGKGLNFYGCAGLKALPKGLKVGRDLNLYGCTGLKKLPKGLKVGGFLYLRECSESLIKDTNAKGFKVLV
jgi:hypothetical protein